MKTDNNTYYEITTSNSLINYYAKLLALKKIGDFFGRFAAIINIKKLYMIANIRLINQKRSISHLKTQT